MIRKLTALVIMVAIVSGCTSQATILRRDGFNLQAQGFRALTSEPFGRYEKEIRVRVIVVEDMADMNYHGAVGTYSHPEGIIRIVGKKVKGKIILNPSVLGHEVQHALEYQDPQGVFVNPDKMEEYGY